MDRTIDRYFQAIEDAVRRIERPALDAIVDALFAAYLDGRQVFVFGNGASAALAAHMACDLGKGTAHDLGEGPQPGRFRRLRIQSLADNVALLTAYSNDLSYEDVYVEQLKTLLAPGDVAIGISGSGGSPNVLRALAYARSAGAVTIGFTGSQATSVLLCQLCDIAVQAPLMMMEQIEDIHVMLHHAITVCLRQRIGAHCRAAALAAASAGAP